MYKTILSAALLASFVTVSAFSLDLDGKGKGGSAGGFRPRPPGGVTVKPTFPVGIKPTFPVGIKPMPPKPIGIAHPPIGIVKPPVIGIVKPPVIGKPVHPPIGIVGIKPPVIGIVGIKPPVKPPVIGIIKPPVIGIVIGKPPVKPPVIGIVIGKPPVKPPVIGIVIPKPPHKPTWPVWPHKPHHPHYPHYPHWPHRPHCPIYGGVGVYTPIVISEPYPIVGTVQQGQLVLNLQCALPESVKPQELSTINVNLVSRADDYQVFGTLNDASNAAYNVNTTATGGTDETKVSLKLPEGDEVYLEAVEANGAKYYQGTIRLLGRTDKNGLVCQLTVLEQ